MNSELPTSESTNSPPSRFSAFWPIWAGMVLLAVCAFFVFVSPILEQYLADLRVKVPWIVELVFACSRWCVKYWYVAGIMIFSGMWITSALAWALRPQARRRYWCFVIASALVAVFAAGLLILWVCVLFGPVEVQGWRFR